ncbi:MAG TPA: PKD domain-containing protein [Solirubrobacterales bacterium]
MLHRQLLHFLIVPAAVAAGALAAPALDAARADAAQVTVIRPGGSQQTLSLEALAGSEDVVGHPYSVRSSSGSSTQVVTGFSLAVLIEAANADPFGFSYLEVQRPSGGAVQLSNNQALAGEGFADGPPVVYATSTGTAFLRPSGGSNDLNASDFFEAPQGVTIALRKDSPLRVQAEASTLRTRPGEPVEFSSEAEGAREGETYAYSWHFDDGTSASGASTTHSFARRGSYDVVVGVTTPSNRTGASAVVTIQVGPPLEGPDRKGGGTRRDRTAPDHGAATGAGGGGSGVPVPAPTSASASAGSPSPAPEVTPPSQPAKPDPASRPEPAGEQVSGELLSSIAPPPKPQAQQPGARTGKLEGEGGGGLSLSNAALGLAITFGLMGAGALTEARRFLR